MDSYGAIIERGIVQDAGENGYRVRSISRHGIVTPAIKPIDDAQYAVGTPVYFFLFEDGHGKILAACDE